MKGFSSRVAAVLASPRFFWAVVALFGLQALWIVFSAVYPMAFDEAYHFTFIQLYAQQLSPFIAEHPAGFDHLGVVTRDTSYLYHYLLSFPYRLIALFSASEGAQIIALRLINVGFFTAALVVTRRVWLRAGLSPALANGGLLLLTLIPVVPLLAAQINYDNLLLLVLGGLFWLLGDIIRVLGARRLPLAQLLLLIGAIGLTGVLKQAALPLLLVMALFPLAYGAWAFRADWSWLKRALSAAWAGMRPGLQLGLVLFALLGSGLFAERYGGNLLQYGALAPRCEAVVSYEQCLAFGPFERTQEYLAERDPDFRARPAVHAQKWLRGMWYRTFFMINGDVEVDRYQNFAPLPLPALGASLVFLAGLAGAVRHGRTLLRSQPYLAFLALAALFYILVLWLVNYTGYVRVGRTAALNGRYLLVLIAPLGALLGLGLGRLFRARPALKAALAVCVIVLMLQGGGVLSFILRSHESWYWPNPSVQQLNDMAAGAVRPLVIGSEVDEQLHFIKPQ